MLRRSNDTRLLGGCYTLKGAAVSIRFSVAYFHDNQGVLVPHNQIQLALFASIISGDRNETFAYKKVVGLVFRIFSAE